MFGAEWPLHDKLSLYSEGIDELMDIPVYKMCQGK